MAITSNAITSGASGSFGKQIVFRQMNGKTFISAYPDFSKRKLTPKQKKMNQRMADANEYAQETMASEKESDKAQLRLNITRNKLYRALVSEFLKK